MIKTLTEIHEDVPADHYDQGYKYNLLQRYWHARRCTEIKKMLPANLGATLDIGCHSGFITEKILSKAKYTELHGIDVSKAAIILAKKRLKAGKFIVGDAHKLPYHTNYFDSVFCFEALEHIEKPLVVIKEIKRVLKKHGNLYILVPTDTFLFRMIWSLWNVLYPVWRHAHVQSFQSHSLHDLLVSQGFTITKVKRFNANMLLLIKATK